MKYLKTFIILTVLFFVSVSSLSKIHSAKSLKKSRRNEVDGFGPKALVPIPPNYSQIPEGLFLVFKQESLEDDKFEYKFDVFKNALVIYKSMGMQVERFGIFLLKFDHVCGKKFCPLKELLKKIKESVKRPPKPIGGDEPNFPGTPNPYNPNPIAPKYLHGMEKDTSSFLEQEEAANENANQPNKDKKDNDQTDKGNKEGNNEKKKEEQKEEEIKELDKVPEGRNLGLGKYFNLHQEIDIDNCLADYFIGGRKIIVFCFKDLENKIKFEALFAVLINANLQDIMNNPSILSEQAFSVHVSGSSSWRSYPKSLSWKSEGAYDGGSFMFSYSDIEESNGQECSIEKNLPVMPISFYSAKAFNPTCAIKVSLNHQTTYIAVSEQGCESKINYIMNKLKSGCKRWKDKYRLPEGQKNPKEGVWNGYVRAARINEKEQLIAPKAVILKINKNKIILDNHEINLQKIKWICNNDGFCSLEEFGIRQAGVDDSLKTKFDAVAGQAKAAWKKMMKDFLGCFVIHSDEVFIICPLTAADDADVKTAAAIAIDSADIDMPIDALDLKYGNEYFLLYYPESADFVKAITVDVNKEALLDKDTGKPIIDYKEIEPLKGEKCGIEFRKIDLPGPFHDHSQNCCCKLETTENVYFCTQETSKCYFHIRSFIVNVREKCLKAQGEDVHKKSMGNVPEDWTGPAIFMEVDNFKYKGEFASCEGNILINSEFIQFTGQTRQSRYSSSCNRQYKTLFYYSVCKENLPCLVPEFETYTKPFLISGLDLEWQESSFKKFFEENSSMKRETCWVIVFRFPEDLAVEMFLVCPLVEEPDVRRVPPKALAKKAKDLKDPNDLKDVTPMGMKDGLDALTMTIGPNDKKPDMKEPTKTLLKLNSVGVFFARSKEYMFKYTDIYEEAMNKCNVEPSLVSPLPKGFQKYGVEATGCLLARSNMKQRHYLCAKKPEQGGLFRLTVAKFILDQCQILDDSKRAKKKRDGKLQQLQKFKPEDPYMFGQSIAYKQFPPTLPWKDLGAETFSNPKDGRWKGWVFAFDVTYRNNNEKLKPVWCQIEKGIISLKTDPKVPPFQNLFIENYQPKCPEPCKFSEYLVSYANSGINYEDIFFLEKSFENLLNQQLKPGEEKGCTVVDFKDAKFNWGTSWVICALEFAQGQNIRDAIKNMAYSKTMEADPDDLSAAVPFADKYFGVAYADEKKVESLEKVYAGLDAIYGVGPQPEGGKKGDETQAAKDPLYKVMFSEIAPDNFGTECAFWYKGLRIKERAVEINKEVEDNNCCFKFFKKFKDDSEKFEKNEICLTSKAGKSDCLQGSRALMKTLKEGCLSFVKRGLDKDLTEETKEIDDISEHSKCEPEKGECQGFVYIANLFTPSLSIPQGMLFLKISSYSLNFFPSPEASQPIITIDWTDIVFNCSDFKLCLLGLFKQIYPTNPFYKDHVTDIRSVIMLMQNTHYQIKNMNTSCVVVESYLASYIMCFVREKDISGFMNTIPVAYQMRFETSSLSEFGNVMQNKVFRVKALINGAESQSKIVIHEKQIIDINTKEVVLDFSSDRPQGNICEVSSDHIQNSVKDGEEKTGKCCFKIKYNNQPASFCLEGNNCLAETFKLMKLTMDACKVKPHSMNIPDMIKGLQIDAEVAGQAQFQVKIKFDPLAESYGICGLPRPGLLPLPKIPQNLIPNLPNGGDKGGEGKGGEGKGGEGKGGEGKGEESEEEEDEDMVMINDSYNKVIYNARKAGYKGYLSLYTLDMKPNSYKIDVKSFYGVIGPKKISFFKNENSDAEEESINTQYITENCGDEKVCTLSAFIKDFQEKYPEGAGIVDQIKKITKLYEYGIEEGCVPINPVIENKVALKIVCVSIKNLRSNLPNFKSLFQLKTPDFSETRKQLASFFGTLMRKALVSSIYLGRKMLKPEDVNTAPMDIKEITAFFHGQKQEFKDISVNEDGLAAQSQLIFRFSDFSNCKVNYNLVHIPNELSTAYRDCVLKVQVNGKDHYLGLKDMNCYYSTIHLAKLISKYCAANKGGNAQELVNEQSIDSLLDFSAMKQTITNAKVMLKPMHSEKGTEKTNPKLIQNKAKMKALQALNKVSNLFMKAGKFQISSSQGQESKDKSFLELASKIHQEEAGQSEQNSKSSDGANKKSGDNANSKNRNEDKEEEEGENSEIVKTFLKEFEPVESAKCEKGSMTISRMSYKKFVINNEILAIRNKEIFVKTKDFFGVVSDLSNFAFKFADPKMYFSLSEQGAVWTSSNQDIASKFKQLLAIANKLSPDLTLTKDELSVGGQASPSEEPKQVQPQYGMAAAGVSPQMQQQKEMQAQNRNASGPNAIPQQYRNGNQGNANFAQ